MFLSSVRVLTEEEKHLEPFFPGVGRELGETLLAMASDVASDAVSGMGSGAELGVML